MSSIVSHVVDRCSISKIYFLNDASRLFFSLNINSCFSFLIQSSWSVGRAKLEMHKKKNNNVLLQQQQWTFKRRKKQKWTHTTITYTNVETVCNLSNFIWSATKRHFLVISFVSWATSIFFLCEKEWTMFYRHFFFLSLRTQSFYGALWGKCPN